MGGDGGTAPLPQREHAAMRRMILQACAESERDAAAEQTGDAERLALCAISRAPLVPPNVVCGRGWLYNKDALIEWLLRRAAEKRQNSHSPTSAYFAHINGISSVMDVHLHFDKPAEDAGEPLHGKVVCCLSGRQANATRQFIANRPCGCVMSAGAMRSVHADLDTMRRQGRVVELGKASNSASDRLCCEACDTPLDEELPRVHLDAPPGADLDRQLEFFARHTKRSKESRKHKKAQTIEASTKKRKVIVDSSPVESSVGPERP
ncbi:Protein RTF2-like [Porphyridium purpureum]|uniref:Protein RTF2-like n=1 Tax=Porphyridium purpureum TaxID=35688 RepID=A0A5J4YLE4_PORPP|nr:Protein RTF2-like [Porphyridium purpureum]|eukprot:POR5041..scf291_13